MTSIKYSTLPGMELGGEDSLTFDYSSPFTYDNTSAQAKFGSVHDYKSVFTYGDKEKRKQQMEGEVQYSKTKNDKLFQFMVTFAYYVIYLFTFPIMVWFSFKKIPQNQRVVVFRLGKLHKAKGPGVVFVFPLLDRCHNVDVALKAFSVPPKQIITGDGAIIEVGAEIFFQIHEPEKTVTEVQNLDRSTRILLQTGLCNLLAPKSLSEIETERRALADSLMARSNEICVKWGVEISRVELSTIKVLGQPQAKARPTVAMPPGLFGGGGAGGPPQMPNIFAQFAQALSKSDSPEVAAVAEAVQEAFGIEAGSPDEATNQKPKMPVGMPEGFQDVRLMIEDECPAPSQTPMTPSLTPMTPGGPTTPDPAEILASIQAAICPTLVQKVKATYQFEISGPGGGVYFLDLKNGDGFIGQGQDPSGDPEATLVLTFDDLQAMLEGDLQPFNAYMSGRLKVKGDVSAAMKLEDLGKRIRAQRPPVVHYS